MAITINRMSSKFFVTFNNTTPEAEDQDEGTYQALYEPSPGVSYEHENLATSSSGRTQGGVMELKFIKSDIVKVGLKWNYATGEELLYLKKRLQGKKFKFKYYDCGEVKEMYAYCGKLNYTLRSTNYQGLGVELYENISANIIDRAGKGESNV